MTTKLVRRLDWAERLTIFLLESQREKLACDWEFFHCATWISAGVEEMTGIDIYAPFRDFKVTGPESAYKAMKKGGFDSMEEYLATLFEEVPVAFAQRGDVIVAPADQTSELTAQDSEGVAFPNALGIADPPFYWALGIAGVGRAPLSAALQCFRVGS